MEKLCTWKKATGGTACSYKKNFAHPEWFAVPFGEFRTHIESKVPFDYYPTAVRSLGGLSPGCAHLTVVPHGWVSPRTASSAHLASVEPDAPTLFWAVRRVHDVFRVALVWCDVLHGFQAIVHAKSGNVLRAARDTMNDFADVADGHGQNVRTLKSKADDLMARWLQEGKKS